MSESDEISGSFCAKYLGNRHLFAEIEGQTIGVLCDNGFDSFLTLMAMDFDLDLPQIAEINFGQKALIRRALTLLREDYEENGLLFNDLELDQIMERIDHKLHSRPKSQNGFHINNDLDLLGERMASIDSPKDITSVIPEDMRVKGNHSVEDIDLKEKNLSYESDVRSDSVPNCDGNDVNLNDWGLTVKKALDEKQYLYLKSTVKQLSVRVERYKCDMSSD